MVDAEQFRIDNKLDETTLEQIRIPNSLGFFRIHGHDKCKRPLVWIRGAKLDPTQLTRESSFRFAAYTLDYCSAQMAPTVD